MARLTLEYDLTDPDDRNDAEIAQLGMKYMHAISDAQKIIRDASEYNEEELNEHSLRLLYHLKEVLSSEKIVY